jgi:hypothetical protein
MAENAMSAHRQKQFIHGRACRIWRQNQRGVRGNDTLGFDESLPAAALPFFKPKPVPPGEA